MTYDPSDTGPNDNTADGKETLDLLDTGSITDSNDGQAWETLREMGYEKGDFKTTLYEGHASKDSTSSDTYSSYVFATLNPLVHWDTMFPSSVQGQVGALVEVDDGGDQIDVRVQNSTDGETAVEQTGLTGTNNEVLIGPEDYTPTTTGSTVNFTLQFRNGDNSTSVQLDEAYIVMGVEV